MEGECARATCLGCGRRRLQLLPQPWAGPFSAVHPHPCPETPATPGPTSVRLSARPPMSLRSGAHRQVADRAHHTRPGASGESAKLPHSDRAPGPRVWRWPRLGHCAGSPGSALGGQRWHLAWPWVAAGASARARVSEPCTPPSPPRGLVVIGTQHHWCWTSGRGGRPPTTLHLGLVGRQVPGSPLVTGWSAAYWPGSGTRGVPVAWTDPGCGGRRESGPISGASAGPGPPPSSTGCTGPSARERPGGPVPGSVQSSPSRRARDASPGYEMPEVRGG